MAEFTTPPANNSFTVSDDMSNDWSVVDIFDSEFEASVARGALESEGIPVMLTNQTFSRIYPIGFNSIGGVSLWVPNEMANQALEILRRNRDE